MHDNRYGIALGITDGLLDGVLNVELLHPFDFEMYPRQADDIGVTVAAAVLLATSAVGAEEFIEPLGRFQFAPLPLGPAVYLPHSPPR